MKRVLHIVQHIAFAGCFLIILSLIYMSGLNFKSAQGTAVIKMRPSDANTQFVDSYAFNQMFGASINDILTYGAMETRLFDVPESRKTILCSSKGIDSEFYKQYYDYFKNYSNINFYLVASLPNGNNRVVSNMNYSGENLNDMKSKLLNKSGKYLLYDLNGNFETNTKIDKSTVDALYERLQSYYFDDLTLYVGLNDNFYSIEDSYKNGIIDFNLYMSNFWIKIIIAILLGFIWCILLVILTLKERKLQVTDSIPIELRILLFAICLIPYLILTAHDDYIFSVLRAQISKNAIEIFAVVFVVLFITDVLFGFFYYGFVRRAKNRIISKTSYIAKAMEHIAEIKSHDLILGIVIPVIVLLINILLGILFTQNKIVIVALIILDIFVCTYCYKSSKERGLIIDIIKKISGGDIKAKVDTKTLHGDNKNLGEAVNSIQEAVNSAVDKSMKDERMKADLITNVSHDLKTPLTSIINYVDLLKKEIIDNEKAQMYIGILDEKSQRLKQLTDDLVEASKISSGNVVLNMEKLNVKELLIQAVGEFQDKFDEKNLSVLDSYNGDDLCISADSRSIYRIVENLFTNIYKYALEGTRIYLDAMAYENDIVISVKNISAKPLNISVDELTERFTRGDESRTTEGSGLGLSIAKSLTEAMGGQFKIQLDGDLFKVFIAFPVLK